MAPKIKFINEAVHWFMSDLTARVVAKTGIPSDIYHMGKLILQSFKDAPEFIMQIDGATDEQITFDEAHTRSVKCATCYRNMGLEKGDVVVIMAPNHIDISIPFYAAMYLGIIVSPVDVTFSVHELQETFKVIEPKIIFCQSEKAPDIQLALNNIDLSSEIVTFDKGDYLLSFSDFLQKYGEDIDVDDFVPEEFDPAETIGFLVPTSGTTGLPKSAAITYKNFAISGPHMWSRYRNFPTPTRLTMITSPMQWLTAMMTFTYSPIMRYTRLLSSKTVTQELAYKMINKYRPSYTVISPTMMTTLIRLQDRDKCDFTCFEVILLGGSAVPNDLIDEIKSIAPDTDVFNAYGMTEITSVAFYWEYPPPGSCGRPLGYLEYRLIDIETNEDIYEPNTPGELWLRGPSIFKEYYKNPEATADTFAEDRWFKTGDMFYRDQSWHFYFVERLKLLLKYKSYQISPVEIERLIRQHPGVLDVAVVGIPDPECGDLVVACVVKSDDIDVSADDIKLLVKENLSDAKQLRGGVIFLDSIPMTASTKVHRRKLKELALSMPRE